MRFGTRSGSLANDPPAGEVDVDIASDSLSMEDVVGMALLAEMLLSTAVPPNIERSSLKPAVKSDLMALLSSWAWAEKARRTRRGVVAGEVHGELVPWVGGEGSVRFGK